MKNSKMICRIFTSAIYLLMIGASRETAQGERCQGEGLQPDYTGGCRDYFHCKEGRVTAAHSCPEGLAFSAGARQCVPRGLVPCVRHECASWDSSLYAAPATRCRFYYRCDAGLAVNLACPSGSRFDYRRQDCTRSAGVCYEPVCTGRADGPHLDTSHACARTLHCRGGALHAVSTAVAPEAALAPCPEPRATNAAFPVAGTDRCAGLPDGRHAAPATHCRDYVVCQAGETEATVKCPGGRRFDGEECVPAADASCPDECSTREDGLHADLPSGCREYFYCRNRASVFRAACDEGSVFDGLVCVSPAFYDCPSTLERNPCLKEKDGLHRDFRDCRSYFRCSGGRLTLRMSCASGEAWDGTACVRASEFPCEGPAKDSGCAEGATGFRRDRSRGSDCRNYYHCSREGRTNFSCPAGRSFDGERCVRSETYECPSLAKDSCDFKTDGLYRQVGGGCRAYYMCSKGYESVFLCDVGQAFDGEKCVDAGGYACPFESDDCAGKADGYHKDLKSGCRKYFFCENGEKLTTIQCSGSKLYDGSGCVRAEDYQCPEGNPCAHRADGVYVRAGTKCRGYFECASSDLVSDRSCPVGRVFDGVSSCAERNCSAPALDCERDGLFPDLATRCRSYHICIDKRKSTLQCEGDRVFNGQLCVPEETFPCPDECSQSHCSNTI